MSLFNIRFDIETDSEPIRPTISQINYGFDSYKGAYIEPLRFTDPSEAVENRKCIHHSHDPTLQERLSDWGPLYPACYAKMMIPHGKIPNTDYTYTFVKLVVDGAISLYKIGLDPIEELYVLILKEFVPKCYNIWDLVERILNSIQRVKNPNYMAIMRQLQRPKSKWHASGKEYTRKATPEDFGIVSSKRNIKGVKNVKRSPR